MRLILMVIAISLLAASGCSRPPAPDPPRPTSSTGQERSVTEAIDAAVEAIAASPRDPALRETLGRIYQANRMNELAIESYDQALAIDDHRVRSWYLKANTLARLDRLEEAIAALDAAQALDDSYGPLHIRRGFWLLDLGLTADARKAFQQAQVLATPTDVAHIIGMARVDLQAGQPQKAVDRLRQLRLQLDHPYVRFLLGTALRQTGEEDEARALLASATGDPPRWPDPWLEEMRIERRGLSADFDRASEAVADGRLSKALTFVQEAIDEHGETPALLNKRVEILVLQGSTAEIPRILERSLELDPEHAPSHLNLSLHFSRLDDHPQAMAHTLKAISLQPTMAQAHLQKARIHLHTGQNTAAAATLDEAFRLGITDLGERSMYARTLFLVGRFADAARQEQQIVLADPTRGDDWVVFIECLQEMRRPVDARRVLTHALKNNPGHAVLLQMARDAGATP